MRGFVIFVIGAEGAHLRRVSAAVVGMFAAVAYKDGVVFEVRRCGPIQE